MSNDEKMIGAFNSGTDIHKKTASEVFGVPEEAVTDDMRRRAKAVNFGIVYGISDFGLAKDIGITRNEAKSYIEAYFATYPRVKAFLDSVVAEAKRLDMLKPSITAAARYRSFRRRTITSARSASAPR